MYRGLEVQPFAEAPRVSPADTMPVHGGEPPMTADDAANLHNPLAPTQENLAAGKNQFNTFCAPCHGETGRGDGPAAHILRVAPSNLIDGTAKGRSEGYIYGVIRDGVRAMPSYAGELPADQRWQAVMYLKSLQQPDTAKPGVAAK